MVLGYMICSVEYRRAVAEKIPSSAIAQDSIVVASYGFKLYLQAGQSHHLLKHKPL